MPSVRYYNQTAPFWDFIASMEEQGASHPFFASNSNNNTSDNEQQRPNPWVEGWGGMPFGPFAHRGRHGPPRGRHHEGEATTAPDPPEQEINTASKEKQQDPEEGPSDARGPPPPFSEGPAEPQHGPGSHRGRCGGRGRAWGGRGGWGGRGRGGPFSFHGAGGPMGGLGDLAEMFQSQLFGQEGSNKETSEDFKPEADVFDTVDSFVIHVSLPGAKKEDISVAWDAESSQLNIAGVVHRPGDEELLKTLALDERKVGAFERKIRLGSRANPAQVDSDGISAKLEDGVLRIDVPKLDSGYVEIKKVDIE